MSRELKDKAQMGKKVFAKDISDKGLFIYKDLLKLNKKETNNPS